ncbi:hypothetical protein [Altererythrobacter sp. MF3-039]|uniref:hypothetical protein n=1 Tax=Altererythrobacter sp. MF3-039 TaxID=3252901 RepID=UPI00390CD004
MMELPDVSQASEREIDLEVISASWRVLSDPAAFGDLVAAWSKKLQAASEMPNRTLVDPALQRQFEAIRSAAHGSFDLQRNDPLENAITAVGAPTMVLSPEGVVVTLSDRASEYFGVTQGRRADLAWFRTDLFSCLPAAGNSGPQDYAIMAVPQPSGREALAEVYLLSVEPYEKPFTVVRSLEIEWGFEIGDRLEQAFGLTQAETQICKLLFEHVDLAQMARVRKVQIETVRTQLKRILVKTETHSRTQLIRLLSLMCARSERRRPATNLRWSDPNGNEQILRRKDGRDLAFTWIGAKHGRSVLYLHSRIPYFLLSDRCGEILAERRIKLICPSLPGNGNSAPAVGNGQLEDGCNAIVELCEHLELSGIPACASYRGQYYLSKLAYSQPHMFSRLLFVGIPWSLGGMDEARSLVPKIFADLAMKAPDVFALMCELAFRLLQREGVDWFLRQSYSQNAVDRQTIFDAEVQPLLRAGCRHLFNQGSTAFIGEEVMVANVDLSDWLASLKLPAHWLVPESTLSQGDDALHNLQDINSRFTMEVVKNTGQLLPYQRTELFLARLEQLAFGDGLEN